MYQPPKFKEERVEVLHELIRSHPLGLLVTAGSEGLNADLVPFLIREDGFLIAHIARANPQAKYLAAVSECLVVFQGPQAYITPAWYAAKQETGRVVPTWNYAVVQAYGKPRVIDDTEWIRAQVEALTNSQESPRSEPWEVSDAPDDYVQSQLRGIVGIEIEVTRLEGKWKVSQNRSVEDRITVRDGVQQAGDRAMAELVAEWGGLPGSD